MGYRDILELQSISGSKAKQDFLKQHCGDDWMKQFLYYAMNPLITYNLSEKTLRTAVEIYKHCDGLSSQFGNIFECCEYLSRLRGMDTATLAQVQMFLCELPNEDEREVYIKLLSKTLRLGVTSKTINKAMGNLIPEWEVQQSYTLEKYPLKEGTEFWLTQKLNGVRATFYKGQLIARSGIPYKGLDHIIRDIAFMDAGGFVLDGELTLKDKGLLNDNEAFRAATGIINSNAEDKSMICYTVFDAIPIQDFESADPKVRYSIRRCVLDALTDSIAKSESVSVLPVLYHGKDQSMIDFFLEKMIQEDKEGCIVNTDTPYKRIRHKGILKVKRFYTMDLPIVGCEEGNGRLAGTLGAFVVSYKGNEVSVGSGFSDEQRAEFWNKKEEFLGRLCEIKYKEISSDQNTGMESLQFPVFVGIREDKSEVSFY